MRSRRSRHRSDEAVGFNEPGSDNVLEISRVHDPNTDYVTVIAEVWSGVREDPATEVGRYLALYNVADVPEQLEISDDYYGWKLKVQPEVWAEIEVVQGADGEAERARSRHEYMMNNDGWGQRGLEADLYKAFMEAIDTLVTDPDNEEAWAAVDAWRTQSAHKHER